jgi:predicted RNA-binding protein Jag
VADNAMQKEVRDRMLDWDDNAFKLSLVDFRKTFYTENEREATYADYLAHDQWEVLKTEMAIRQKWGAEADAQFASMMGFTTREQDLAAHIEVTDNHAVITWDIKDSRPDKMIKVDGKWLDDVHALWDQMLADDPNFETNHVTNAPLMKQIRADIADGKYDDADSCIKDIKTKLENPNPGN